MRKRFFEISQRWYNKVEEHTRYTPLSQESSLYLDDDISVTNIQPPPVIKFWPSWAI